MYTLKCYHIVTELILLEKKSSHIEIFIFTLGGGHYAAINKARSGDVEQRGAKLIYQIRKRMPTIPAVSTGQGATANMGNATSR